MKKIVLGFLSALLILYAQEGYAPPQGGGLDLKKFQKEKNKYEEREKDLMEKEEKERFKETEKERDKLCELLRMSSMVADSEEGETVKDLIIDPIERRRAREQPNWKDKTVGRLGNLVKGIAGGYQKEIAIHV